MRADILNLDRKRIGYQICGQHCLCLFPHTLNAKLIICTTANTFSIKRLTLITKLHETAQFLYNRACEILLHLFFGIVMPIDISAFFGAL